jgi:SRSO17 transposase
MDTGYGTDTDLRTEVTALGLAYVAGIHRHTSAWGPGTASRLCGSQIAFSHCAGLQRARSAKPTAAVRRGSRPCGSARNSWSNS